MKIYVISDTHFNHKEKMCELAGRPENYEEQIINNVRRIPKYSLLICLGDVCIGKDEWWNRRLLSVSPCYKILVKGNHDSKSNNWYTEIGWSFVCTTFSDTFFGKNILFSHKPIKDCGYDFNIHGHFHNTDHRTQEPELVVIKNDKQILISLEQLQYKPINLEKLIRRLK